jgi:hypothetical protein
MKPLELDLRFGKVLQLLFVSLISIILLALLSTSQKTAKADSTITTCDEASLLAALNAGGTINFACNGIITLTTTPMYGIEISKSMSLDANGYNVTISGSGNRVIFKVSGSSTVFTITNLILRDGKGNGTTGGAIFNTGSGAQVLISNTTFISNSIVSGGAGGAVGTNNGGIIKIYNSTFDSNMSFTEGGAVTSDHGSVSIEGSSFYSNTARNNGGAISSYYGTFTVTNSLFVSNTARSPIPANTINGGAIYNYGPLFTISNSVFRGNSATGDGGALYNLFGTLNLSANSFEENTAANRGGVLYNYGNPIVIAQSSFVSNTAGAGGVIYNDYFGRITIGNSTLFSNIAVNSGAGGAIYGYNHSTTNIINTTISNNAAVGGGGGLWINPQATAILTNTIVANSPSGGNCSNNGGTLIDGGNNLQFNPDSGCVGLTADPKLGPLGNNGGPTKTLALLEASQAIDQGNNNACSLSPVNGLDQRSFLRPTDPPCDIGAYEAGPHPSIVTVTGSPQSTPINTNFPIQLEALVRDARVYNKLLK